MWFLADFGIIGLIVLLGFLSWFFVKGWMAYQLAPRGSGRSRSHYSPRTRHVRLGHGDRSVLSTGSGG